MKITVSRTRCEGYGFCAERAPELLRLDDDGELEILAADVTADQAAAARRAVRICPVAALSLEGETA